MQKKLTITVEEDVYEGLHKVIGRRKISQFIEDLKDAVRRLSYLFTYLQ